MLDENILERRLIKLEKSVVDLQQKLSTRSSSENWLEQLIGSISDEEAFLEALEYGRVLHQADKPIDQDNE